MSGSGWDDHGDLCVSIVEGVCDATDRVPADLPPLQRSVDVDAIGTLVSVDAPSSLRVEFDYAGAAVTVDRTGVNVTGPDTDRAR